MPRPHRSAAAAILVGVGVALLVASGQAAAQESPPPATTTTTRTAADAPVGDAPAPSGLEQPVPEPCAEAEQAVDASIVPDDCWGRFPSSHYDIGFDEGAWNHISRKVYGTFTDLAFQGARSVTAVGLWLVDWAYSFGVYDHLGGPAVDIAEHYQRDLIGPLRLGHIVWFYAVAWAAVVALRGRLTMAAGELLISVLTAGLAGIVLANPAGYLQGTFDTMGKLSGALLATGTGEPPPTDAVDAHEILAPLQDQIHAAFVEQPYDYLNWGGPLPPQCTAARDRILATGPHGAGDEPRAAMTAARCEQQADFNHDPTGSRLFGAVLTFGAAATMVVLLALVAVTVVVAQVIGVVLFAIAPLALLAGILPGAGRELAWRWVAALIRVVLAVVGMSFVLSLLLLTVTALLETTAELGLVERFALVNIVVIAMLVARKRILAAGHNLASNVGQRLATRRAGGDRAAPWLAGPAIAGATGFAVGTSLGPDRNTRTTRTAAAAGRNYLANRRVTRSQHAADTRAERRASATSTRHRTEFSTDGDGRPITRSVITVDGPPAISRRARATRARLEHHASGHAATHARHRHVGWATPQHDTGEHHAVDEDVDDAVDADLEDA